MDFDFRILDYLQTLRTPFLDAFFSLITHLGDAGIVWIVLAIILVINPKTRRTGAIVTLALVFDLILCNCILKPIFARTRPYDINTSVELLIKRPKDYSFPSGHTAASFASAVSLLLAKQKTLTVVAFILAVLIAFSRIYLYVHYPTDILGGALAGTVVAVLGFLTIRFFENKKKLNKRNLNG